MDHILLDRAAAWPAVQPDVVLQLGGRLTSKRLQQFLEWSAIGTGRCALLQLMRVVVPSDVNTTLADVSV